jgi:NTE family protein
VIEAVRASISVPGIFTPVRSNGRILVDGGLTNPVPVSAVRAMGADFVIAVDLNHQIVAGKNMRPLIPSRKIEIEAGKAAGAFSRWVEGYRRSMADLKQRVLARDDAIAAQLRKWNSPAELLPSIFEVLLASINIMETAVTEARLARDPPDLLIRPPLGHIRFLEFARAEEIIRIGYESTREALGALPQELLLSLVDVGAGGSDGGAIQQDVADRPGP